MTDFVFVARDGAGPSRNGLVTDMEGWDLAHYLLNPVVLFAHQSEEMPIGRAGDVGLVGQQMLATVTFAETLRGVEAETLVASGMLNGMSVGIRLLDWEIRRGEGGMMIGVHSHRQELLELSVLGLPAQATALVRGREGFISEGLLVEGQLQDSHPLVLTEGVFSLPQPVLRVGWQSEFLRAIHGEFGGEVHVKD